MQQEYQAIGILGKPHGTSGAFHFKLIAQLLDDAGFPEVLFLKSRDALLPYFVKEWNLKNNFQGSIMFEDVASREAGANLVNAELMLKTEDFDDYFEVESESYLIGYTVVDEKLGELGKIIEVTDNTVQEVAVVQHGAHQVMFPLVEQFIESEDASNKILKVKLPEGLVDAYTNNSQEERDED